MSLHVIALVRNEMHRFFPSALASWTSFADEVHVLDDSSDDGSYEFARDFGVHVVRREEEPMWGREASAREELLRLGWAEARVDDYIFVLDADMTPARDPKVLLEAGRDGVLFGLYDLWKEDSDGRLWYREDEMWRGHLFPRIWMIRKRASLRFDEFSFGSRGMHVGHFPRNLDFDTLTYAPEDFSLLHHAYVNEEVRAAKYEDYAKVASDLHESERIHARSIMDPHPRLIELPFEPELRLRCES